MFKPNKESIKYLNDSMIYKDKNVKADMSHYYSINPKAVWYIISAILTHELVCVPLSLAKSEAIMNSPSKATSIVTVSEDIDHV